MAIDEAFFNGVNRTQFDPEVIKTLSPALQDYLNRPKIPNDQKARMYRAATGQLTDKQMDQVVRTTPHAQALLKHTPTPDGLYAGRPRVAPPPTPKEPTPPAEALGGTQAMPQPVPQQVPQQQGAPQQRYQPMGYQQTAFQPQGFQQPMRGFVPQRGFQPPQIPQAALMRLLQMRGVGPRESPLVVAQMLSGLRGVTPQMFPLVR